MKENINHSITHDSQEDLSSRYYNLNGEHYRLTQEEIEELGRDFLKWARETKDAYKVGTFFRRHGWGYDDITNWKKKYPYFKKLYLEGKEEIGDRREIGALKRKLDSSTVNSTLRNYSQEYYDHNTHELEQKAALSKEVEQPATKIVVIEKFENEK